MIGYTVMGKTRNKVKQEDILVTIRVFVTENYKLYLGTFGNLLALIKQRVILIVVCNNLA